MFRIDNASNSSTLPAPTAAGPNPGGYFIDKDPENGIEGTVVPAEWLNAMTEEVAHVIEDADGGNTSLNKGSRTQLKTAIATMVSRGAGGARPGTIRMTVETEAPEGESMCDGGELDRVIDAALFDVIGTTFGPGDGINTFNKPDFRGRFPLGLDNMGGPYANRVTAASTGGANAGTLGGVGGAETHSLTEDEGPEHDHPNSKPNQVGGASGNDNNYWRASTNGTTETSGQGAPHNNMPPWIGINFTIKL